MAPRKIPNTVTFDDAEDEIRFTIAALKADPDTGDLVASTDDWMSIVDTARAEWRTCRQAIADTDAGRIVANHRFDMACTRFGDELYLAVGKDSSSRRWTQHFDRAVSRFVRMPLGKQLGRVLGWLSQSTDEVLARHRDKLELWTGKVKAALEATGATAIVRGRAWIGRETMAESLTAARDGLFETLAARARERDLGRDWPDIFFRKTPGRDEPAPGGEGGGIPPTDSPA